MKTLALCTLSTLLMTSAAWAERREIILPPTFPNYSASVAYAFIGSCMQFAGDPSGLRTHLAKLAQAEDSEAAPYLQGRAGKVFAKGGKKGTQIVLSLDDGGCEMIATNIVEKDFRKQFDQVLQTLNVLKSSEHVEPDQAIKDVEYLAREAGSPDAPGWRLVLSFPTASKDGFTLLSAYPLAD